MKIRQSSCCIYPTYFMILVLVLHKFVSIKPESPYRIQAAAGCMLPQEQGRNNSRNLTALKEHIRVGFEYFPCLVHIDILATRVCRLLWQSKFIHSDFTLGPIHSQQRRHFHLEAVPLKTFVRLRIFEITGRISIHIEIASNYKHSYSQLLLNNFDPSIATRVLQVNLIKKCF